jgi:hypothetical protein
MSLLEDKFDDSSDERHMIIDFIAEPSFYGLYMLFFFILYLGYFIVQQSYLDSILESVEGATSSNTQGSLYVEASKHIE